MHHRPFFRNSIFLTVIACFLWSTAFAGIKIGLKYTSPLQFAGIRFMLSGLIILPFCRNIRKDLSVVRKNAGKVMLISIFQTAILYIFFYLGMDRTPAAVGAIVVGGGPLFVALLAHFITGRDPLTLQKVIALLIGFSGIILLTLPKAATITDQIKLLTGIGMLVIGNIAGSFGNILVSQNRTGISPVFLNALQIFTGGFFILIVSFFFEGFHFGLKPLPYYLSLVWLAFLSATAFSLWFVVLSRPEIKVSEITIWKFIIPVLGAIISWLLIKGEKPQWHTLTGMILIALSIVIIYGRFFRNRLLSKN
jgi:drug/metabolite transporter (DMT)-like permease